MSRFDRLVHTGNAVVDLALDVPRLPPPGGDVLATATRTNAGGAVNVMVAAARLGLATVYAGAHGTGPHGDLVRSALAADGVGSAHPADPSRDTGFVVVLVDATGERTFVTSPGAEAHLADLSRVGVTGRDAVVVSGYGLVHDANRRAIAGLLEVLDDATTVVFDPGPLGSGAPIDALAVVLARADWLTANAAEAGALSGADTPAGAAEILLGRCPRAQVVVRLDARGALLATRDAVETIPPHPVPAVDATGAGDAHTGALLAALGEGAGARDAVAFANRAAAWAVTRPGPATGPTRAQLASF